MIEVVSIKFKNRGKSYFFSPNSLTIKSGDKVIVETSKGIEMADCVSGNHFVPVNSVVQPLRPVLRVATAEDLRVAEINRQREKEAFEICQKKIEEHGLDMKLVDVECNFEGNKTLFFFTSDGRVDFRELVKDLAGVFRNRIELRQIGVRDEAKMIGGIGICGRPYCCSQFLDDFQPVSTKMAKVQSLSLNPTKISGSCGRLMCCLRYEQEAYEELIKKVPKQGAFVETKDGYGTAVQVNLLRQTVKVKLDEDSDDTLRLFKANELCAVPGGRPKDGEAPPHVLVYVPEEEEEVEEVVDQWVLPMVAEPVPETVTEAEPVHETSGSSGKSRRSRSRRGRGKGGESAKAEKARPQSEGEQARAAEKSGENAHKDKNTRNRNGGRKPAGEKKNAEGKKSVVKAVKVEAKVPGQNAHKTEKPHAEKPHAEKPHVEKPHVEKPQKEAAANEGAAKPKSNHRRRYYHGKPKAKSGGNTNKG